MDLKIRLPENLDARLRDHAEKTGATLNSIVCLAIDAFLPGGEKPSQAFLLELEKRLGTTPKRPIPPKPKMSAKPTKDERQKMAEWDRAYGSGQRDLLGKL
jgi:hypothetical protein